MKENSSAPCFYQYASTSKIPVAEFGAKLEGCGWRFAEFECRGTERTKRYESTVEHSRRSSLAKLSELLNSDKLEPPPQASVLGVTATSTTNHGSANGNYSMYDYEQITRATIGLGALTVASGTDGGINRDIDKAQEITKALSVDPITGKLKYESDTEVMITDENGEAKKHYVVDNSKNNGLGFAKDVVYVLRNFSKVVNSGQKAELGENNIVYPQDKLDNDPHGGHPMRAWDFGKDKLNTPVASVLVRTLGETAQLVKYGVIQNLGKNEPEYDINGRYLMDMYHDVENQTRGTRGLPILVDSPAGQYFYTYGGRLNSDGSVTPVVVPFGGKIRDRMDNPKDDIERQEIDNILNNYPRKETIFNGRFNE